MRTMTVSNKEAKPINLLKSEYKLLGKIGSGGFSFVYLVERLSNGEMCAAKFQVRNIAIISTARLFIEIMKYLSFRSIRGKNL